jgi:TusA-related sulfurtransferase
MKLEDYEVKFSGHSLTRMFQRKISVREVILTLKEGRIIETYPDDSPYPSDLKLFYCKNKPIHVVSSIDRKNKIIYIITAYIPDEKIWDKNFENRREK